MSKKPKRIHCITIIGAHQGQIDLEMSCTHCYDKPPWASLAGHLGGIPGTMRVTIGEWIERAAFGDTLIYDDNRMLIYSGCDLASEFTSRLRTISRLQRIEQPEYRIVPVEGSKKKAQRRKHRSRKH
jgi:hypothetical protein